ncbi:MAG: hypothetical protein ACLR0U_05105 [Enterocloster clostridioformis]
MGIGFEDGLSGRLTLVGGMARTERGRFIQNFNIRYPVTADAEALVRQMERDSRNIRVDFWPGAGITRPVSLTRKARW